SATTARAFWDAVASSPSNVTLALSASDLYSMAGGAARLSCHDLAPVVRRAALYLDTPGYPSDLGAQNLEVFVGGGTPSAVVSFPTVGRVLSFSTDRASGT